MSSAPNTPPPNFSEPKKKKRSPDSLEALLADLPVLEAPADLVPKSESGATFGRGAAALAGVAGLGFLGLTAVFSYRRSLQRHLKEEAEKLAGRSGASARQAAAGPLSNAAAGPIKSPTPPAPIDPKVLAMAHSVARRALMYSFMISGGMFAVGVGVIAWSMDVQSLSDVKARAEAALRPIRDGVGGGVAPAVRRIAEKPAGWLASLFRGAEQPQDGAAAAASAEAAAATGVAALPALQGVAPAGGDGATELLDSPAMRELHPAEQRDVYRLVAWVQRQMEADDDGGSSSGSNSSGSDRSSSSSNGASPGGSFAPAPAPAPAPADAAASASAAVAATAATPPIGAAPAAADNAGRLR